MPTYSAFICLGPSLIAIEMLSYFKFLSRFTPRYFTPSAYGISVNDYRDYFLTLNFPCEHYYICFVRVYDQRLSFRYFAKSCQCSMNDKCGSHLLKRREKIFHRPERVRTRLPPASTRLVVSSTSNDLAVPFTVNALAT